MREISEMRGIRGMRGKREIREAKGSDKRRKNWIGNGK